MNQLVTERKSLLVSIASKYGMDPEIFKTVLLKTIMPSGTTNEQLAAFLMVADRYELNPIIKEIHAFPSKKGGIEPMVGVDGFFSIAQRHPAFDGIDFEYAEDDSSITCIVYRNDRQHPTRVTEFMDECKRNTIPWQTHPKRMLRHKAAIQALRYAFGFSGIRDEDDLQAMEVVVSSASINEQIQEKLPEAAWPQQRDGTWYDSRGIEFHPDFHGMKGKTPSVTPQGHFRKRRGCDEVGFATYERQQLSQDDATDEGTAPDQEAQTESAPSTPAPTYAQVENAIRTAKTDDELDSAKDLMNDFDGTQEQTDFLLDMARTVRSGIKESEGDASSPSSEDTKRPT